MFPPPRVLRVHVTRRLGVEQPAASVAGEEITARMSQTVHVVIPLAGRVSALARLLREYGARRNRATRTCMR
jgi:hypothetical protein